MFWARIFSAVWTLATFDRDTEFEGNRRQTGQFVSSKNSHFQTEAKFKTFLAIVSFICMRIKLHFHINGFAPSFALKQRLGLLLWLGISVSRNCSTVYRMPKMRTIYFTMGFSSIKLYLSPTEASYNVSPFSFQGEIIPCFVFLERNKNCGPFPFF